MKKPLLIAATAALLMTSAAASAQPWRGGPYGDRDRDGVPNYVERGRDRDHDGRRDDRDRWDNRRGGYAYGHGYGYDRGYRHWRQGERFDHYRSREYIVYDYRRYGWRPPPRGYAYYRTDSGDVVMAALATGLIASIIASGY